MSRMVIFSVNSSGRIFGRVAFQGSLIAVQGEMGNHALLGFVFNVIVEEIGNGRVKGQLICSNDLILKIFDKPARIPDGNFHEHGESVN